MRWEIAAAAVVTLTTFITSFYTISPKNLPADFEVEFEGGSLSTPSAQVQLPDVTDVRVSPPNSARMCRWNYSGPQHDWPEPHEVLCQKMPSCGAPLPTWDDTGFFRPHTGRSWRFRTERLGLVKAVARNPQARCADAMLHGWDWTAVLKAHHEIELLARAYTAPPPHKPFPSQPLYRYVRDAILGWQGPGVPMPACHVAAFPCVFVVRPREAVPGDDGELRVSKAERISMPYFTQYGATIVVGTASAAVLARVWASAAVVRGLGLFPMAESGIGSNLWHNHLYGGLPVWVLARALNGTAGLRATTPCAAIGRAGEAVTEREEIGCEGTVTTLVPWWYPGNAHWPLARSPGGPRAWFEFVFGSLGAVRDVTHATSPQGKVPVRVPFLALGLHHFSSFDLIPNAASPIPLVPEFAELRAHVAAFHGLPLRLPSERRFTVHAVLRNTPRGAPFARHLVGNWTEVGERLAACGWRFLGAHRFGQLSPLQQLAVWNGAAVTIAVHGADITPHLYGASGRTVLEVSASGTARCYYRTHVLQVGLGYQAMSFPAEQHNPGLAHLEISQPSIPIHPARLVEKIVAAGSIVGEPGAENDAARHTCGQLEALGCANWMW